MIQRDQRNRALAIAMRKRYKYLGFVFILFMKLDMFGVYVDNLYICSSYPHLMRVLPQETLRLGGRKESINSTVNENGVESDGH
jgi:hypothetical protein